MLGCPSIESIATFLGRVFCRLFICLSSACGQFLCFQISRVICLCLDRFLVKQDCIKPLCDLLTSSDSQIVMLCLEALEKILKVGEVCNGGHGDGIYQCSQTNVNPHAQLIEEAEGLEKIEGLQCHENIDIYDTAVKILETYWVEEEDEEEGDQGGQQDMIYFPLDNFANMPTTPSGTLSEMYCGS